MRRLPSALLGVPLLVLTGCAGQVAGDTDVAGTPVGPVAGGADLDGPFRWLGGRTLRSDKAGFGGLSGLAWHEGRLTGVGDRGLRFTLRPDHGPHGRLAGIRGSLGPLPTAGGESGLARHIPFLSLGGGEADAEAITPGAADGWLVSFERRHRIEHYGGDFSQHTAFSTPAVADLPSNRGLEALTRLADGRLLAIAETGAAWVHDGAWTPLAYPRDGDFAPAGAAGLPDGGALVVERSHNVITGSRVRLVRLDGPIPAEGTLDRTVVLPFADPVPTANFEGLAVRPMAGDGKFIVYAVSDDNFNPLRATHLVTFRYAPGTE